MNHSRAACKLVRERVESTLNKGQYPNGITFKVYTVISTYILGYEKHLISTDLPDGKYFEVTYNAIENEYYLDEYVRVYNECIPCKLTE